MQNCEHCGGKKWFAKINRKTGEQEKHIIKFEDKEYTLRVWRCFRCNHVQSDEIPYILPSIYRTSASILYIDLEVSKSRVYNYGLRVRSGWINPEDLDKSYYIICWAASYLHDDKIWSNCVSSADAKKWSDERYLKKLNALMHSADIIAGHNVDAYDIKRANTRFLMAGLEPVIGKPTLDTLKIARSKFAFESNRLDFINRTLGFQPKDEINNDDWLRIVKTGDRDVLKKVHEYCRNDVRSGKDLMIKFMNYSGKRKIYGSVGTDKING